MYPVPAFTKASFTRSFRALPGRSSPMRGIAFIPTSKRRSADENQSKGPEAGPLRHHASLFNKQSRNVTAQARDGFECRTDLERAVWASAWESTDALPATSEWTPGMSFLQPSSNAAAYRSGVWPRIASRVGRARRSLPDQHRRRGR